MKTAAVLSSLVAVGSLAFAAGQGTVRVIADPSMPADGMGKGGITAVGAVGCFTIGEPLDWFTTVHLLPECATDVWGGGPSFGNGRWAGDANDDGVRDDLVMMRYSPSGYVHNPQMVACTSNFQGDGDVWFRVEYSHGAEASSITMRPVLSQAVLLAALAAIDPQASVACFIPIDITDMDGDDDLDMVFRWNGSTPMFWVENTSVAVPPLAADLNGDGSVNGVDLAFLLNAWTQ